jgi:hypothetical protein
MAMLTNAHETQVVQSLGVRLGPPTQVGGGQTEGGELTTGKGCPFTEMIPTASDGVGGAGGAKPPGLVWTAAAEARLANIPAFVRPMARTGIERFARERGASEVDERILDAARDFFGM